MGRKRYYIVSYKESIVLCVINNTRKKTYTELVHRLRRDEKTTNNKFKIIYKPIDHRKKVNTVFKTKN